MEKLNAITQILNTLHSIEAELTETTDSHMTIKFSNPLFSTGIRHLAVAAGFATETSKDKTELKINL